MSSEVAPAARDLSLGSVRPVAVRASRTLMDLISRSRPAGPAQSGSERDDEVGGEEELAVPPSYWSASRRVVLQVEGLDSGFVDPVDTQLVSPERPVRQARMRAECQLEVVGVAAVLQDAVA